LETKFASDHATSLFAREDSIEEICHPHDIVYIAFDIVQREILPIRNFDRAFGFFR
jgi:hypothetical protein